MTTQAPNGLVESARPSGLSKPRAIIRVEGSNQNRNGNAGRAKIQYCRPQDSNEVSPLQLSP
jgi:hypothetical protein